MSMKFNKTLKDKVSDAAREIGNNAEMAYDLKKKEIEETVVPKWAMEALTPEEIRRSQRIGLVVGATILILVLLFLLWSLTR